jgi:hypothetical protein
MEIPFLQEFKPIIINFTVFILFMGSIITVISIIYLYPKKDSSLRSCPPKAVFFEKTGGKEKIVEGPYEEQYLTYKEKRLWDKKSLNQKDKHEKYTSTC